MYRKCISITVVLCSMVVSNYAFGVAVVDSFGYQDDWHNSSLVKYAEYNEPATITDGCDWHEPCAWGAQRNKNNGGTTVPCRPPDFNVFAAIEPKPPGPNVKGDVKCSRLSIQPWSWANDEKTVGFTMTLLPDANDINCGSHIGLADMADYVGGPSPGWGYPILNIYGGTMHTPGFPAIDADGNHYTELTGLHIGGGGTGTGRCYGTINMYGGSIIVPRIIIYFGDVNLYGGLLYDTDTNDPNFIISLSQTMNRINIEGNEVSGGELRLQGNRQERVWYYAGKGKICPCKGRGTLFVEYNDVNNYTSVTAYCTPGSAWDPKPPDRKDRVELAPTLTWKPGPWVQDAGGTGRHAVYFGLNEVNVTNATTGSPMGVYKGKQDPESYTPGQLLSDTDYFWRIDEYNDVCVGESPWKGNIWQFKTKGPVAGDPVPDTNAVGLPVPLQLSWSTGSMVQDVNGHDVYFGTNEANVADDKNDNYLHTYQGRQGSNVFPLSSLSYDLAPDTNYYWRIDEVNGLNVWKGEVWMFRNTNYFIIDNFENYDSDEALLTRWQANIFPTWVYYSCPYITSSGKIGWVYALPGEGRGVGSMRYNYDDYSNDFGTYYFSEVRFDANGADWTGGGALPGNDKARALAISYIGMPSNDADPNYDRMYVAIEDTAGHFGSIIKESAEAQRTSSWKEWNINLTDLNSPNVNLKAVKYLYLGFGIRCNDTMIPGGTGTVRFDDIRLYQKRCVPAYAPIDLNGDCRVDINDINMFADQWPIRQTVISPVTRPPDANLMLWYDFNEVNDANEKFVKDSAPGIKHHGVVVNPPDKPQGVTVWDATGGYDGNGCINLRLAYKAGGVDDYNTLIVCPNTALNFVTTKNAITFSVWVNADIYSPPALWPRLISVFQDMNEATDENEVVEIECPVTSDPPFARFVAGLIGSVDKPDACGVSASEKGLQWSDFGGGWNHYAFVEDADANLMRIYHNGELIAETNNTTAPMFGRTHPIESFRIGKRRIAKDEPWAGKIDDFRVYDYALSQAEIGWLGTKGTGYVPFRNVANFKGSSPEAVNFGDYALLAQRWLAAPVLWP